MSDIAIFRKADNGHEAGESAIATMLAVPCWSSWKAVVRAIQPEVLQSQPSRTGPETQLLQR